jgi:thioredoxin-like negative regulator of GroEL
MNLERHASRLRHKYEANRLQFIVAELDLAITFCQIATTTNDQARYDRNISNAQQAYAAAVHFLRSNRVETSLDLAIEEKLSVLSAMLGIAAMQ